MLKYGFELEYNGTGHVPYDHKDRSYRTLDLDIYRSYADGTYPNCWEVCGQPQVGLTNLFQNYRRVLQRTLEAGVLGPLYSYNQYRTGLHVSVNDPAYVFHQPRNYGDTWKAPLHCWKFVVQGITEVRPLDADALLWYHRVPRYEISRIKVNRVESARGLSTLNPYCFLQYVFMAAMHYHTYRALDRDLQLAGLLPLDTVSSYNHPRAQEIRACVGATPQALALVYETYRAIANDATALLEVLKETTDDPCDVREILAICRDAEAFTVPATRRGTFDPTVCQLGYYKRWAARRLNTQSQRTQRATTA